MKRSGMTLKGCILQILSYFFNFVSKFYAKPITTPTYQLRLGYQKVA